MDEITRMLNALQIGIEKNKAIFEMMERARETKTQRRMDASIRAIEADETRIRS